MPFLLLKPNRRAGAWLILVPFGLVAAAVWVGQWMSLSWLVRYFSSANSYFMYAGQIIPALRAGSPGDPYLNLIVLASSLCLLCLMTYALANGSFIRKVLSVLILFSLPGILTLSFFQVGDEGNRWGAYLVYAFVPLLPLVSLILTGKLCRKHWNLVLFSVLFFLLNLVFLFVLRILYVGSLMIRQPQARPQWWNLFVPRVTSLWQGPTVLFTVAFLFILTAFLVPLYRERLKTAFKVFPAPQPQQRADGGIAAS